MVVFQQLQLGSCYSCKNSCSLSSALCDTCFLELEVVDSCCLRCGQATAQSVAVCGQCLKSNPAYDGVLAAYHYKMPVDSLIQGFKQGQNINVMKALLPTLIKKILANYSHCHFPEALVPVPMHWIRLWRRGFNQSFILAKAIQKVLPQPVEVQELVKRSHVAAPQKTLSRVGRRKNVKNGFELRTSFSYKHVVIVDDVVTTGATSEAMAALLKAHGAEKVDVWSLARA